MDEHFDCKGCGHCCDGTGGIIVSNKDLARLSAYLQMPEQSFEERYCEKVNGKRRIKVGPDKRCIFFVDGTGCGVHVAKPGVCKAWPFFRGNLIDSESLTFAKEYCPGIPHDMSLKDFVAEGLAYLKEKDLIGEGGSDEANALQVRDIFPG